MDGWLSHLVKTAIHLHFFTVAPSVLCCVFRWGRNQETISEDPHLNGVYAAQFTAGMQTGSPSAETEEPSPYLMAVATLKHVVGYSLEDWSPSGNFSEHTYKRQTFNANISKRDLNDSYLPAFQAGIEGGAAGIMCVALEI